jgi:hypothetical protein
MISVEEDKKQYEYLRAKRQILLRIIVQTTCTTSHNTQGVLIELLDV